jgi:hypothetical protein
VADHARDAAAELEQDFRELRGLARAGLAAHDHDGVLGDGTGDLLAPGDDREVLRVARARQVDAPPLQIRRLQILRLGLSV